LLAHGYDITTAHRTIAASGMHVQKPILDGGWRAVKATAGDIEFAGL
jgi:hypothetical protein